MKPRETKGLRIDPAYCLPIDFVAGCYGVKSDGDWLLWPPGPPGPTTCPADLVTVHPEDGTATIEAVVNTVGWCGYLRRGVWVEGIELAQESVE
ncbi:MAG TPA: hypothetical protein VG125_33860 [Pirellulales bacterium]|jgi:hypothetical protein|nr:hypothetical protein [Pirellulales bacterium]